MTCEIKSNKNVDIERYRERGQKINEQQKQLATTKSFFQHKEVRAVMTKINAKLTSEEQTFARTMIVAVEKKN